jgi:hypothetical protein
MALTLPNFLIDLNHIPQYRTQAKVYFHFKKASREIDLEELFSINHGSTLSSVEK